MGQAVYATEGTPDTLRIVALWDVSGYAEDAYEIGLYFTPDAAKQAATVALRESGYPGGLIWQQHDRDERDTSWSSLPSINPGGGCPDYGMFAIYPREVHG